MMKVNHSRSTPPPRNRIVIIFLSLLVLVLAVLCAVFAWRSGSVSTALIKLGLQEDTPINKDAYKSWANCLNQLSLDADIVFIGDSITAGGNFQSFFADKTVCNLGCYGDQIWDVTARIPAVAAVKPETVYIMIGTNTLACRTLEQAERAYTAMASAYAAAFPDCAITFLSVLPVAAQMEDGARTNGNIAQFNAFIQSTAKGINAGYIDLHRLYVLNGMLNPQYTQDGLHITADAYSLWVNALTAQ